MADPPAPAMRSAVATGACSRTTANTMAAPSWDCAPICCRSEPTSRAMTIPNGMDSRIKGSVVTRARNQHWSKNSETGMPLSGACRRASEAVANMLPVSRTAEAIFPVVGDRSAGPWEQPRCGRTAAGAAQPACHLLSTRSWGGVEHLIGYDTCARIFFSQRRPPFRGLLGTERARGPPPVLPSQRKREAASNLAACVRRGLRSASRSRQTAFREWIGPERTEARHPQFSWHSLCFAGEFLNFVVQLPQLVVQQSPTPVHTIAGCSPSNRSETPTYCEVRPQGKGCDLLPNWEKETGGGTGSVGATRRRADKPL